MYVSQIMWDTILCNMTECQVRSQNVHLFIFFVEPKWLNKMKGNVEWAKESSLKVTGKTLWASILCTSRCSSLSSFSIKVMSSRQKGHNILLTLFKCFIFCLTLELTKKNHVILYFWRKSKTFTNLIEESSGLKKSWMRGRAELARETVWNCTCKTCCYYHYCYYYCCCYHYYYH